MPDRQLTFTERELLSECDYATAHEIGPQRLQGGFDAEGRYMPPRSAGRRRALDNWTAALRERGGDLFDADAALRPAPRAPNAAQQIFLLRRGIGRPFWNALTVNAKLARRRLPLASLMPPLPELDALIEDDIDAMALGHLGAGLLKAHGFDEGGDPQRDIGGHDAMWLAARNLVFPPDAHPDVEPLAAIPREDAGKRRMAEIDALFETLLSLLMHLLARACRAEADFADAQQVLRAPELFADRRGQADEAAAVVERIRAGAALHIESLRLYLGEFRELSVAGEGGVRIAGRDLIDPYWEELMRWLAVEQPKRMAERQHRILREEILAHAEGARILRAFEELADAGYSLAAAEAT